MDYTDELKDFDPDLVEYWNIEDEEEENWDEEDLDEEEVDESDLADLINGMSRAHKQRNFKVVKKYLSRSMEICPLHPLVINNLGAYLSHLGKYDEALMVHLMSMEIQRDYYLNDGLGATYLNIAELFKETGDKKLIAEDILPELHKMMKLLMEDVTRRLWFLERDVEHDEADDWFEENNFQESGPYFSEEMGRYDADDLECINLPYSNSLFT